MTTRTTYRWQDFFDTVKNKINELNPTVPTFWGEGSVIRGITQGYSHMMTWLQLQVNITYISAFIKTAKGLHLERLVANFGMSRRESTAAIVYQTFLGDANRNESVNIDAGTIVSRNADIFGNIVSYELTQDLILTTGYAAVTGICVSTTNGTLGNCPSGTIINLSESIVGISGTINSEIITNGANIETDIELRSRVSEYLLGLKAGNESAILSEIKKIPGINYVSILENHPAAGNFTVYVSSESGTIDSVTLQRIRDALRRVRGFTVTATVIIPSISYCNIAFDLTLYDEVDEYKQIPLLNYIKSIIFNYVNTLNTSSLYRADIITLVKKVSGVKNIKNITINSIQQDLELAGLYVIKLADMSNTAITVT
jgi:uncharacterized phage protein gp47/JayE